MKKLFTTGDKKKFKRIVEEADTAVFETERVHPVYSTFALTRDAEWTCRQFVLQMKDADEEGIGTFVTVEHHSPALPGETVIFEAVVESIRGNEIICRYKARAGKRLIASGRQGQKILKKAKIAELFKALQHG